MPFPGRGRTPLSSFPPQFLPDQRFEHSRCVFTSRHAVSLSPISSKRAHTFSAGLPLPLKSPLFSHVIPGGTTIRLLSFWADQILCRCKVTDRPSFSTRWPPEGSMLDGRDRRDSMETLKLFVMGATGQTGWVVTLNSGSRLMCSKSGYRADSRRKKSRPCRTEMCRISPCQGTELENA